MMVHGYFFVTQLHYGNMTAKAYQSDMSSMSQALLDLLSSYRL